MRTQPLPESCTKCRGTALVRMLWGYFRLTSEDAEAISAKKTYLGLNHRYFTSADPTLVVGEFFAKKSGLPAWVCLDCSPQWADVDRLASTEWQVAVAKDAAVQAHDFERAAALLHDQQRLEAAYASRYERLLRELVARKETAPRGA
jgi:hypothetical protein